MHIFFNNTFAKVIFFIKLHMLTKILLGAYCSLQRKLKLNMLQRKK